MTEDAVEFSELSESVGTLNTEIKRDWAGAKIIAGWEQFVTTTTSEVMRGRN